MADFAAWTGQEGVCVSSVVVQPCNGGEINGSYSGEQIWLGACEDDIMHPPETVLTRQLCRALEATVLDVASSAPGLFSGDHPRVLQSADPDARSREHFAQVCQYGPPENSTLGAVDDLCQDDWVRLTDINRYLAEVAFPGHPQLPAHSLVPQELASVSLADTASGHAPDYRFYGDSLLIAATVSQSDGASHLQVEQISLEGAQQRSLALLPLSGEQYRWEWMLGDGDPLLFSSTQPSLAHRWSPDGSLEPIALPDNAPESFWRLQSGGGWIWMWTYDDEAPLLRVPSDGGAAWEVVELPPDSHSTATSSAGPVVSDFYDNWRWDGDGWELLGHRSRPSPYDVTDDLIALLDDGRILARWDIWRRDDTWSFSAPAVISPDGERRLFADCNRDDFLEYAGQMTYDDERVGWVGGEAFYWFALREQR